MREIFTYGSVGRALGNRCLYPELDSQGRAAVAHAKFVVNRAFTKASSPAHP